MAVAARDRRRGDDHRAPADLPPALVSHAVLRRRYHDHRLHRAARDLRPARDVARPDPAEPPREPSGPLVEPPVRHRRARARCLVASRLRRAHGPASRLPRGALPVRDRHDDRARRRLLRPLVRHHHELGREHRRRLPVLRARDRARVRTRVRDAQHLHRDHDRRLGLVHAHRARRGSRREAARVRPRRARCRAFAPPDHRPPSAAERDHAGGHLLDVRHRARHPRDRHPRLPRPRRAATRRPTGDG